MVNTKSRSGAYRSMLLAMLAATLLLGSGCPKNENQRKSVIVPVTWPNSDQVDRDALNAIPSEEAMKVATSLVPVLVPKDSKILSSAVIIDGGYGYSFTSQDEVSGLIVNIRGTRIGAQHADLPAVTEEEANDPAGVILRGTNVSIYQGEVDWQATWVENGKASYQLRLYCTKENDSRCTNNTYIKEMIVNLVYIGGSGK